MYDILIIGAGVTGSFIARALSKYQLKIGIVDKHIDAAMGASGANSGIIHAGYDAKPGSLKAKFNIEGSKIMKQVCYDLNVSYDRCGSMVVAFSDEEMETLHELLLNGQDGGIKQLSVIDGEKVRALEPMLNDEIKGALLAETAAIVSPYKLNINALLNAVTNGVEFIREQTVIDVKKENNEFVVKTDKETYKSKFVINCAGVYADEIARMVGDDSFHITPRSGEYILLDKTEGNIVSRVIFQAPTKKGKGVLVTKTVDGNLLIGPDAKILSEKGVSETHREAINFVYQKGLKTTDKLLLNKSITVFTGVRATPDGGDFIVGESKSATNFINVAGIESPGLSSAPAIGNYVRDLVIDLMGDVKEKDNYIMKLPHKKYFHDMNDDEKIALIKTNPLYGKVVCRCENVTEGEIVDAIHQKAGARTVDGVKRRTRAGMGRCQGGFCMPLVLDILARELNIKKEDVTKGDSGSYILEGKTRA